MMDDKEQPIQQLESQNNDFLGRGWNNPIEIDPRTGRLRTVEFDEDIEQSIRIILETAPGERVMRPSFGCGVHDLVFSTVDSTVIQRVKSTVTDALQNWEPRIEVTSVTVPEESSLKGELRVSINYRVRKTNQDSNTVFPFYFDEGGNP